MEFRTCGKCHHYSHSLMRCSERGQVNPAQLNHTISAMRIFGADYICRYSKWKEKAFKAVYTYIEDKD